MAKLAQINEDLSSRMSVILNMMDKLNAKAAKRNKRGVLQFSILKSKENIPDDENLVKYLNQFDPTGAAGVYTQWIVRMLAFGQFMLPDDGEVILRSLSIFHDIKSSRIFKHSKDINSYKKFSEFEKIMRSYMGSKKESKSIRQWNKWIKTQGYNLVYKDEKYVLLKFTNTGKNIKIFPKSTDGRYESEWVPIDFAETDEDIEKSKEYDIAAIAVSKLACGTGYCVVNPSTAQESYLKRGPLFAIFKNGKFYLLADYIWSEFANNDNINISKMSPSLAFFLSKAVLLAGSEIGKSVIPLQNRLRSATNHIKNERLQDIITKAINYNKKSRGGI